MGYRSSTHRGGMYRMIAAPTTLLVLLASLALVDAAALHLGVGNRDSFPHNHRP